jgi:hypothetical protein
MSATPAEPSRCARCGEPDQNAGGVAEEDVGVTWHEGRIVRSKDGGWIPHKFLPPIPKAEGGSSQ